MTPWRPTLDDCFRLRNKLADAAVTYPDVGATRGERGPAGYRWRRTRMLLGHGRETFAAARAALAAWQMFPAEIAAPWPTAAPIVFGQIVVTRLAAFGCHALGPCRIVDVEDESSDDVARFGFAYGTLPGHLANGEERFIVQWNAADDSVWYELTAFSRPAHPLAWLGLPLLRSAQRRFVRRSHARMREAVAAVEPVEVVL